MKNTPIHPAVLPEEKLLASCDERRLRRGGPGGQHRNKVETAVELTHRPTGIAAEANERRSQQQNREVAIRRLRIRLALAIRTEGNSVGHPAEKSAALPEDKKPEEPIPVSPLWSSRVRGGRLSINPKHADFPSLLAEALDHLAWADWDTSTAAEQLSVSTSQLVKLLRLEHAALKMLNDQRKERGQKPLN